MNKLLIILILIGGIMLETNKSIASEPALIQVSGEGSVKGAPDMATLTFSIKETGKRMAVAQSLSAKKLSQLESLLTKHKIPKKNYSTIHFSVNEDFRYEKGKRTSTGYIAHHSLSIKVINLKSLGNLIDDVVKIGVKPNTPRFGIQKEKELRLKALDLAVKDAKNKASVLAKAMGKTLASIYRISEGGSQAFPPPPMMMREAKSMGAPAATTIHSKDLEIVATVSAYYRFK